MALSIPNNNFDDQGSIEDVLNGIKDFFSQNLQLVSKSKSFFSAGLDDEFVVYLKEHLDKPLDIISHGFGGHIKSVGKFLEAIILKFFYDNKENISAVYRSNEDGGFLHYFIVLKNDDLKNRRPFFSFLQEYEKENLSKQYPVLFEFISSKVDDLVKKAKEISLTNAKQPKKSKVQ